MTNITCLYYIQLILFTLLSLYEKIPFKRRTRPCRELFGMAEDQAESSLCSTPAAATETNTLAVCRRRSRHVKPREIICRRAAADSGVREDGGARRLLRQVASRPSLMAGLCRGLRAASGPSCPASRVRCLDRPSVTIPNGRESRFSDRAERAFY